MTVRKVKTAKIKTNFLIFFQQLQEFVQCCFKKYEMKLHDIFFFSFFCAFHFDQVFLTLLILFFVLICMNIEMLLMKVC